jgi:hypothetical protein
MTVRQRRGMDSVVYRERCSPVVQWYGRMVLQTGWSHQNERQMAEGSSNKQ